MKLITALATPFCNGKIDEKSYVRLLQSQNAADGLLCCGTTAEGALLSSDEKKLLIRLANELYPAKIWAGISSGATSEAAKEAEEAKKAGATGLLISPPSFFKCTQQGFLKHVLTLQKASELPLMLYNAPSRCGYVLWENLVEKLADLGVGYLKDAGGDLVYASRLSRKIQVFCGNEELLPQFAAGGAAGVVSVVSNVAPNLVKDVMTNLGDCSCDKSVQRQSDDKTTGDETTAEKKSSGKSLRSDTDTRRSEAFRQLAKLAFCQLNPIPVKYMLYKAGVFSTFEVRLPLTAASKQTRQAVDEFWKEFEL